MGKSINHLTHRDNRTKKNIVFVLIQNVNTNLNQKASETVEKKRDKLNQRKKLMEVSSLLQKKYPDDYDALYWLYFTILDLAYMYKENNQLDSALYHYKIAEKHYDKLKTSINKTTRKDWIGTLYDKSVWLQKKRV